VQIAPTTWREGFSTKLPVNATAQNAKEIGIVLVVDHKMVFKDRMKTRKLDVRLACGRALPRELPGAAVGRFASSRRVPSALGAGRMPIECRRSSFHRICLNLAIWNRLMVRFEYTPVDSRWRH
jgi:hypothetical protein